MDVTSDKEKPVNSNQSKKVLWTRSVLTGCVVWIVAFALYMVPAFVVGIRLGLELGPKLQNNALVSSEISRTISEMYRSHLALSIGYVAMLAILVFWRSRVIARIPDTNAIMNGAIVGAVPMIISIVLMLLGGREITSLLPVLVLVVAGIAGGYKSTAANARQKM